MFSLLSLISREPGRGNVLRLNDALINNSASLTSQLPAAPWALVPSYSYKKAA